MVETMSYFLRQEGYQRLSINLPGFAIFFRVESAFVNVIYILDLANYTYLSPEEFKRIIDETEIKFKSGNSYEVHSLSLIGINIIEEALPYCEGNAFSWIVLKSEPSIIVPEKSVEDFYGMKSKIEQFLKNPIILKEPDEEEAELVETKKYKNFKEMPFVNISLVIINAIIFIACIFAGDLIYDQGTVDIVSVLQNGQWYRVLTAMFLHADMEHILSNMLVLYVLGEMVEKAMGHIKYLIMYIFAGIGGSMASLYLNYIVNDTVGSLGASGAIFGMIGALLFILIRNKGRLESMSVGRILFYIIASIYLGLRSSNIDNMAHLGGLVSGFILAIFLYRKKGDMNEAKGR